MYGHLMLYCLQYSSIFPCYSLVEDSSVQDSSFLCYVNFADFIDYNIQAYKNKIFHQANWGLTTGLGYQVTWFPDITEEEIHIIHFQYAVCCYQLFTNQSPIAIRELTCMVSYLPGYQYNRGSNIHSQYMFTTNCLPISHQLQ